MLPPSKTSPILVFFIDNSEPLFNFTIVSGSKQSVLSVLIIGPFTMLSPAFTPVFAILTRTLPDVTTLPVIDLK